MLLVNTDLVPPERYPDSVEDLLDPSWPGDKLGIAYPLFGTTATHAAALYSVWGPERGRAFFEELARRKVKVLAGNSVVRDQVAAGELMFGLTDSDDAARAIEAGWPVRVIVPDQEDGGMGALLIPNTVGMVKGSPHPEPARALIDFLLSLEVERELAEHGWTHFPVRSIGVPAADIPGLGPAIRELQVDYTKVYEQLPRAIRELRTILVAS